MRNIIRNEQLYTGSKLLEYDKNSFLDNPLRANTFGTWGWDILLEGKPR